MITLYVVGTPNGQKPTIALNELKAHYGLEFEIYPISFAKNEQKEEWFLKINPNGRIPAIIDHNRNDFAVFESAAILLYLAEHYDPDHILFPTDSNERSEVIQWLMWQMGGLGPMQGQAGHFNGLKDQIPYAINRYNEETRRLYSVLERHLSEGREWLAAGRYTIADINSFGWAAAHELSTAGKVTMDEFPNVKAWLVRVAERKAVRETFEFFGNKLIENDFHRPAPVAPAAPAEAKWIKTTTTKTVTTTDKDGKKSVVESVSTTYKAV
ncbi:hypothetical protein HDU79_011576 [Rhizoclosmatium sp. JEL0117]|nr:hypothetical protein HDU79_011576 [Rhizoclosmatium sp. JEL0117]